MGRLPSLLGSTNNDAHVALRNAGSKAAALRHHVTRPMAGTVRYTLCDPRSAPRFQQNAPYR